MCNLNLNWDEVREEAVKACGFTKDKAGELVGMIQERLDAMEEEKRRNLYIGIAVFCGVFVIMTLVYIAGVKAGKKKAQKDQKEQGEWE